MNMKLNRLFPSQQQQKRYADYFLPKPLFSPRYVDLGSLPYPCFKFVEDLRNQKIDELVSMHGMYYPKLVKVFYTNMTIENRVISSCVKRVPINIFAVELGQN